MRNVLTGVFLSKHRCAQIHAQTHFPLAGTSPRRLHGTILGGIDNDVFLRGTMTLPRIKYTRNSRKKKEIDKKFELVIKKLWERFSQWCNSTSLPRAELHEVGDRYKKVRTLHVEAAVGGFRLARGALRKNHSERLPTKVGVARVSVRTFIQHARVHYCNRTWTLHLD